MFISLKLPLRSTVSLSNKDANEDIRRLKIKLIANRSVNSEIGPCFNIVALNLLPLRTRTLLP